MADMTEDTKGDSGDVEEGREAMPAVESSNTPLPSSTSSPTPPDSLLTSASLDSHLLPTAALTSALLSSITPSPLSPLSSHLSELLQSQQALLTSVSTARDGYYNSTHPQVLALLPAFAPLEEQRRKVEEATRRMREVKRRVDALHSRMSTLQDTVMREGSRHTPPVSQPPQQQPQQTDVK